MKLSTLLLVNSILALVYGAALVLAPAQTLSLYGVTVDAALQYVAQLLGASLIGFCVLTWLSRYVDDPQAQRAVILSMLISEAIGFVVSLVSQLGNVVNALGWSTVAIYLLLALGYAYLRFVKPRSA